MSPRSSMPGSALFATSTAGYTMLIASCVLRASVSVICFGRASGSTAPGP
ncbi:hypothetical protein ACFWY6_10425 [Streptomyces sp. NPDC059037]